MSVVKRALVADDHSVARRGLAEILRDQYPGVEIHEAADAPTMLDKFGQGGWDIVLLDAMMPGARGVESVHAIRAIDQLVPVLMVTAAAELEYVIQAMKAGVNGVIHKQRASDEMIDAIRRVAAGETYLHPETAAEIALEMGVGKPALPHERLSAREGEIFRGLALGRAVKEIAGDLGISAKTVATYVGRIRQKTNLVSYVEITRYAMQNGLVQ
jgi:two-component system invasion response regulator UvrY